MPPKRKEERQRGQIVRRGDDKFLLRVFIGRDPDGKRRYSSKTVTAPSYLGAQKELTKMLRELDTKTYIEPSKQTVKEYLEGWLKTKTGISKRSLIDYDGRLTTDVYPDLGSLRLDQLTPQAIQRTYQRLTERGLSPRTVGYTHSVLHQALKKAVEWNLLLRNPADYVELPKRRASVAKALSPAQVGTFLEKNAQDPLRPLWLLLLTSGLRPSEALALRWSDLNGPWLSIRRKLEQVGKGKYVVSDELKTEGSRRMIALPDSTVQALRVHQKTSGGIGEQYLFHTAEGTPLHLDNVRKAWTRAVEAAGLPPTRLYDTRHTHLTHLLSAGVNAKAVADRSGHSNPVVLLTTYAHVIPEVAAEMASVTERVLFTKPKEASQ